MTKGLLHAVDPLTEEEWSRLTRVVRAVGNSNVAHHLLPVTGPLGAGVQIAPTESFVGITEGSIGILGERCPPVITGQRSTGIVPLVFKDFVIHWRDLEESRLPGKLPPIAKAAAAAAACAIKEDHLVLFGDPVHGYNGLFTVPGRLAIKNLKWDAPGEAFANFVRITQTLMAAGHNGPFAAVVHPMIYACMHRVVTGSSLLEVAHVKSLLEAGIFRSSLLPPGSGLVCSPKKDNIELLVAVDSSLAFLGSRQMNLPFRVFKAVYLRILRTDAICTFER